MYFGDGLYGVEAASRGYFGKHASELSVPEAALLAGLVKSPSSYAPTVSLERAVARRNVVLQAMLETGAIDRADVADGARQQGRRCTTRCARRSRTASTSRSRCASELVDRFGWQRVYQGGLRVFSTIDMPMQIAAEAAVADQIAGDREPPRGVAGAPRRGASEGRRSAAAADPADPLQAALVALDPDTGHVRAMVGGRDFDDSHFNRAVQAHRQPGSAFKPFVYAAALEAGYHAGDASSITSTIRSRRCRARGRRRTSTRPRRR